MKLVPIEHENLEQLREWRNDPDIYKWCRQITLLSRQNQIDWFDYQSEAENILMFYIKSKTGLGLGVCGLTSIDYICRRAEFSLYIQPEECGNGYGGEALTMLLNVAFNDLNLNLVWGESFEGNPAMKMFEKIGFKKEGIRRQFYYKDGKYVDAHLCSITRSEFDGI